VIKELDTKQEGAFHTGAIGFEATLRVLGDTKPGRYTVPLEIYAQACNAQVCREPTVIRLQLPVVVGLPGR
jgi:hypothetical protein